MAIRRKYSNKAESPSYSTSSPSSPFYSTSRPIDRKPMNQEEFDTTYEYIEPQKKNILKTAPKKYFSRFYSPCTSTSFLLSTIYSFIPILRWLPQYSWRNCLLYDIIGGLTVGILHIPQGIAYAKLVNLDPVVGLYTSFFPVLVYMFFGTSRHCSIGSFAVIALMASSSVSKILGPQAMEISPSETDNITYLANYTIREVASTLTFLTGIVQVLIGIIGLDVITEYFSDQMVAGFTTGASMHVMATQFKDIFGLYKISKKEVPAGIFQYIVELFMAYDLFNYAVLAMSIGIFVFLLLSKDYINPYFQKKLRCPVPIPFELIVVIIFTLLSHLLNFKGKLGVKTVGHIPLGMPAPKLPSFSLFIQLIPDAISISVVILAIHISLAKTFSKKFDYPIDTKQEFYALGVTSLVSGLFPVYPVSCSLARTMVNAHVGTKTQLSALATCGFLLIILLATGSWLAPLPMFVLASIILAALSGMFLKFKDLPRLWKVSKIDMSIWLVSFITTTIFDAFIGLIVSLFFALFTTIARQQWAEKHNLVSIGGTRDYGNEERYKQIQTYETIHIYRFDAPLLFLNVDRFRRGLDDIISDIKKAENKIRSAQLRDSLSEEEYDNTTIHYIIIDCSSFTSIDLMGVNTLVSAHTDSSSHGVTMVFAALRDNVRDMLLLSDNHSSLSSSIFPSIHDAVYFCRREELEKNSIYAEIPSTRTVTDETDNSFQ